ncbi:hypothetical protein SLS62_006845 [Diatrype stigma]|uniref:RING-type domain-containing protein n=1 Tax=Diatrype stigma TaxID=117547 RepID=A0AAN9YNQ9_9PEZI
MSCDPCPEANTYIPQNVTRRANLPMTNYNLVALAPWINTECTKSFFASVKKDSLRALLVYQPDGDTSQPPDAKDAVWDFEDGSDWRTSNHFPVYAISSAAGDRMMRQLSLYSGDLSQVPFGSNITSTFHPDPADYVRVWTELIISNNSATLAVWLFVIIIVGVLVTVIGGTSLLMHCVQRQRRESLRRRVESGEVNLETLGIKRLKVPLDHVQTFPLFTYNYEPPVPLSPTTRPSSVAQSHKNVEAEAEKSEHATDYQPDCQICLEEFQSKQTVIRELPCGHIFHPDCIDSFLSDVSSLCPVCKVSMLPRGYCPKITNGMVRREIATRRLRPQVVEVSESESKRTRLYSWSSSVKRHIRFTASATKHNESIELPERSVIARPSPAAVMPGRTRELIVPVDESNSDDGRPPCE